MTTYRRRRRKTRTDPGLKARAACPHGPEWFWVILVAVSHLLLQPESPARMALLGNAILAVWNEVDPAHEDDFNEWYYREHISERTMVPGLNRGRRYRAEEGT